MSRSSRLLGLLATASMYGLSAGGAYAQQQAQSQGLALEEITVTARKVEENLMTVPVAVTAFSEKDIEAINIKQLTDVMLMTPSFNFVNQVGGSGRNDRGTNSLVFRGLFLANNAGLTGGGQMFIDGAPVIGAHQPAIVDVARIEVLKGPQSAYFGRSTFVGAINFITRDPSMDEFKGRVTAEASSWNSHDLSLSFEGPLVEDKLAARVTGRDFRRGGQFTNATNPGAEKLGRQTTGSLSGSLLFTPTDQLKIKSYVNWFEDNDGPPAQGALKASEFTGRANIDGSCTPFSTLASGVASGSVTANSRASLGYWCGTLPKVNDSLKRLISGDYDLSNISTRNAIFNPNPLWLIFDPQFKQDGGVKRHAFQADIRADYETQSGYVFSSLTAHHHDRAMTIIDLNYRDGHDRANPFYAAAPTGKVPWQQFLLVSQNKARDWSQELRITSPQDEPFRWTLGGNYLDAHTPGGTVYGIAPIGPLFSASITRGDVSTPAVFGAAYYDFTDALTLSLEARYQWDKIKSTPYVGTNGALVTGVAANPLKDTYKSFSPRVSLDYEYAEGSTAYALFSRGYRPGGFNPGLVTSTAQVIAELRAVVPNAGISYEQEKLDNYEVGLKSTWLDGRARTVLTAFYDIWNNGQVQNSIPVPSSTNLIGLTVNNGKAVLKGLEFEGQIQATEGLKLSGTFGLNDTEIKTYGLGVGNCSDCNFIYGSFAGAIGNRLPTTPKYTWTASAEYTDQLTANYNWYTRIDYMHQGSKFSDFGNIANVGSSENVNARIGIRDDNMSIEAFVTNLTQNKVMITGLLGVDVFTFLIPPNKNEIRFSPPLPRAVGVRASYNF
ncbi:MAG: TonB-dependent receptor [Rhodospirillaceae bacterium]|nr:TonB-dependent receptor [Rhodospirillaceae bacterium]